MTNEVIPQFSRKILFLSLIFVLANLGIYSIRFLTGQTTELTPINPQLLSATIGEVQVKSPYDKDYKPAQARQEIYVGTYVKTDERIFADLMLGENDIRLNEQTEIRLVQNNFSGNGGYATETPRLEIELISGSLWINAFDQINVRSPRSITSLRHTVALLSYTAPINRLIVITGAAELGLLKLSGDLLSRFVVPLNNQVTFVDTQITDAFAQLKPSKLKKELKMTPIAPEVLKDEWVARNSDGLKMEEQEFENHLITSPLKYRIRAGYKTVLSWLTFAPAARRNLALERADIMLSYLLGAVEESGDINEAQTVLERFNRLLSQRDSDPKLHNLIVRILYRIEDARPDTPAYLLKEDLISKVAGKEGPYVYEIYLTDLRKALKNRNTKSAETSARKWLAGWSSKGTDLEAANLTEFERQSQILDHTILSSIDIITPAILATFDESGMKALESSQDAEETRFELIATRLQIAASLISSYRYSLAKQYLKNSYLSLGIEDLSPDLASTQVFLETGKLLAQRIEYAEAVLKGAAQPIDEQKFRDYFQILKRDEALSADLRKFFELDQEVVATETKPETPTPSQVAGRFLDARINVNFADISLRDEPGFFYNIKNARLIEKTPEGKTLAFDAVYDYGSNSVLDVMAFDKTFKGPFTLADVIILMKEGGVLGSRIPIPSAEGGVEALLTDQEKMAAEEGQAIAQDVARQLAYSQLTAFGITIPDLKSDIGILDPINLNRFQIKRALITRPDSVTPITISFNYSSATGDVTNVISQEGVILITQTSGRELPAQVIAKVLSIEKQLQAISAFKAFMTDNNLKVDAENLVYTPAGLVAFKDLELSTLKIKVSGLYDPGTKRFISVSHSLLTMQNIGVREYFQMLAEQVIIQYMTARGFMLSASQIESRYPFSSIMINQLNVGGYRFSFTLDMANNLALKISREGTNTIVEKMTLDELKIQPELISPSGTNTIAE